MYLHHFLLVSLINSYSSLSALVNNNDAFFLEEFEPKLFKIEDLN